MTSLHNLDNLCDPIWAWVQFACELHESAWDSNAALVDLSGKITGESTICSQHGDTQSDVLTRICEIMQSDQADCNQTLVKTHTHSLTQTRWQWFVIIPAGSTPSKQEKMIVLCSMHSLKCQNEINRSGMVVVITGGTKSKHMLRPTINRKNYTM